MTDSIETRLSRAEQAEHALEQRVEELEQELRDRPTDMPQRDYFKELLPERLKDGTTRFLLLLALLVVIAGGVLSFNFNNMLFVIGAVLISVGFSVGGPLYDGSDSKKYGKIIEAGFLSLIIVGLVIGYFGFKEVKSALDKDVADKTKTIGEQTTTIEDQTGKIGGQAKKLDRWNLMGTRTAPEAKGDEVEFTDELYNQIGRDKDTLSIPRFADGGRWLAKMPDGVKVVLKPGMKGDKITVEVDVDKLVVKGTLPDTARLYYVTLDDNFRVVVSKSRQLPPVGTQAK